jgi:hypothetical protein
MKTKGNESQRGLLQSETLRTDRSNNMIEMTDLSLKEELYLQHIPSSDNSASPLKAKHNVRETKMNQNSSARSGQPLILEESNTRHLDASWNIPNPVNPNDKSGALNGNIYKEEVSIVCK